MEQRPRIRRLRHTFSIHRLPARDPLPAGLGDEPMVWIGRTEAELSVVCRERPERAAWGEVRLEEDDGRVSECGGGRCAG
mgnify:CR=1 FL=1